MGASLSWLVADARHLGRLKELLGAGDKSDGENADLCVTLTPSGQLFVFEGRGRDWTFDRDDERKRLSADGELVFGMLEEHVMASEVALWRDGVEIWRLAHCSEEGMYHLEERGVLPPCYQSLKEARLAEQEREGGEDADVDCVISVPMDLAAEFTGYDGGIDEPEGEYFEWSCPVPPKPPGFLARLFGRTGRSA